MDWAFLWISIITGNRSSVYGNRSLDVLCKNCVNNFDVTACFRSSCLGFLSFMTSIFCAMYIFKLHRPIQTDYHKLILFYILFLQCVIGSFEWLLGWNTGIALFNIYARALELLIICHLYLMFVARLMNWRRSAASRLPVFGLTLMCIYFTIFFVLGITFALEPWYDCHAPYWIWISVGNVIIVQEIVVSFLVIIFHVNGNYSEALGSHRRKQLYILLWVFETSSIVDLGYHISLFMLADEEKGCSGIFRHDQFIYTAVKVPYELVSFLLPIWVILIVFRPLIKERVFSSEGSFLRSSFLDGTPQLINSVVIVRNWRRRYRPLGESQRSYVNPSLQVTAHQSRSSRSSRSNNRDFFDEYAFRRTQSAPTFVPPRRGSVSHSVVSSPLYPIPEEGIQSALESVCSISVRSSSAGHVNTEQLTNSS